MGQSFSRVLAIAAILVVAFLSIWAFLHFVLHEEHALIAAIVATMIAAVFMIALNLPTSVQILLGSPVVMFRHLGSADYPEGKRPSEVRRARRAHRKFEESKQEDEPE